jgi:hypothetical protein
MDKELETRLQVMFAGLNRQSAADSFPDPGTLAGLLSQHADTSSASTTVAATPQIRSYFATAAVEMWLRSVHSFLISASLTTASPIWSSVAGYYSSHYAVRAFAHLFGVFQLYKKGKIARLDKDGGHFVLEKKGSDGEHKFYWKEVIKHPQLANDPFFYPNFEDQRDGGHRNKMNYWDHICRYPTFQPLETQILKDRVQRISTIPFSSVPTPRADKDHFPDIDNVQIIAYHRLVKFRRLVDEVCLANRFWKVQRTPAWCPRTLMNFSVVESVYLTMYMEAP